MKTIALAILLLTGCSGPDWVTATIIQENRQVYYETESGFYDIRRTNTLVEDSEGRRYRLFKKATENQK